RLTEIGYQLGLIEEDRYQRYLEKNRLVEQEKERLRNRIIKPEEHVQEVMREANATPLKDAVRASDLLKRPEITYKTLMRVVEPDDTLPEVVKEQVEIQIMYEGYIKKANEQVDRMLKMEDKKIPEDLDYDDINGLATEARQRLKKVRPLSVGQASRISGVNPSD